MTGLTGGVRPGLVQKVLGLHRALERARIDHAFGGAIALAYAVDEPRATGGIVLNISAPVSRAQQVLAALPEAIEAKPDVIANIARHGQDRLRWGGTAVDLFFPRHDFHEVVARRASDRPFAGSAIPVISPTDLVVFKTMFDRSKDWPDIEAILRAGTADEAEALRWAETILGPDRPSRLRLEELVDHVRGSPRPDLDCDPNPWTKLGAGRPLAHQSP